MKKIIGICLISVLLAGCGAVSGKNNYPKASKVAKVKDVGTQVVWKTSVGKGEKQFSFQPAYSDGKIYAISKDGVFTAINAETGKQELKVKLKNKLSAGLTVDGGLAFVGTKNGELLAISAANGKEVWRAQLDSIMLAPATVGDGILVAYTAGAEVVAFNPNDGTVLWKYQGNSSLLSMQGTASPIVEGGIVVITGDSGEFIVLDQNNGLALAKENLKTSGSSSIVGKIIDQNATPKINRGRMFASSYQNRMYAVDLGGQGGMAWENTKVSTLKNFALDEQNIYIVGEKDVVVALAQQDGHEVWRNNKLIGHHLSPPEIIAGGKLAVVDNKGTLFWLDATTGSLLGSYKIGGSRATAVVKLADMLIWQLEDGKVVAVRPK
ncbi:MAG: outer membrane protein assembly factor BamB [Cardiobacteriaceae bacterium]|nr:outer membrane protein assembly factor BamB [Cardiobacteriaceae bacterium]